MNAEESDGGQGPTVRGSGDTGGDAKALHAFLLATAGGFIVLGLYSLQFDLAKGVTAFSVAAAIAGASLVAGSLLGFLFGIPRSLTDDRNGARDGSESAATATGGNDGRSPRVGYGANTNLEQISDWLTKILVGVGLVQFRELRPALSHFTTFVAPALGEPAVARPFALGVVVYFSICGFLAGYLWTRLFLPGALRLADLSALGERLREVEKASERAEKRVLEVEEAVKNQAEVDANALSLVTRQLEPVPGLPAPTQTDLDAAVKDASATVKLTIFSVAHRLRSDNWRGDKAKMERTIPVFRALIASDGDDKYHRNHADLGFALKDQAAPDYEGAAKALTRAIEIRGDWRENGWVLYEYNLAICQIELDPDFQAGKPSSDELRATIIANLSAALHGFGRLLPSETIDRWLELNHVTLTSLAA